MMHTPEEQEILRDLGDGLILRQGKPADAEALAAFNSRIHAGPDNMLVAPIAAWTRDLLRGNHPTFRPEDFTVVVDTRSGAIVSSLCLIGQRWSYGGIEFGVGRPELVGTLPEYRHRGLVRAQFETIHRWSAERGDLLQAITGIRWFYRQFGYEMALALDAKRGGCKYQIPALPAGVKEPFRIRPAVEADLPLLQEWFAQEEARSLVSCVRDAALWRYELNGRSEDSLDYCRLCVLETTEGKPVGALSLSGLCFKDSVALNACALKPGVSWFEVAPSLLRGLWAAGEANAAAAGHTLDKFLLALGEEHPLYQVIPHRLPMKQDPYAFYLRVPDLPAFIRHVAPVLERRLAESVAVGYSGTLALNFYRDGLRLVFEKGRLQAAENYRPAVGAHEDAAFPGLTFLKLLFGYRSLAELEHASADCWASVDTARILLPILFPKQPSAVWPVG